MSGEAWNYVWSDDELRAALAAPMGANDAGAPTVLGYLGSLLFAVWTKQEGFSGKRPFGNSGWDGDVLDALAEAGLIDASDDDRGRAMVAQAIEFLASGGVR